MSNTKKTSLGFVFTPLEEVAIRRARVRAREFFTRYGKGRDPYLVDINKYYGFSYIPRVETNVIPIQFRRKTPLPKENERIGCDYRSNH